MRRLTGGVGRAGDPRSHPSCRPPVTHYLGARLQPEVTGQLPLLQGAPTPAPPETVALMAAPAAHRALAEMWPQGLGCYSGDLITSLSSQQRSGVAACHPAEEVSALLVPPIRGLLPPQEMACLPPLRTSHLIKAPNPALQLLSQQKNHSLTSSCCPSPTYRSQRVFRPEILGGRETLVPPRLQKQRLEASWGICQCHLQCQCQCLGPSPYTKRDRNRQSNSGKWCRGTRDARQGCTTKPTEGGRMEGGRMEGYARTRSSWSHTS